MLSDLEISIHKDNLRIARRTYIKTDRNGTRYYLQPKACPRCGGAGGSTQWNETGWECFRCGGSGEDGTEIVKEYTPEYEAKLNAKREAKRMEYQRKVELENAKREAERKERELEESRKQAEEEARIKALKSISQHFGKIGERYDLELTYLYSAHFEVQSFTGYGTATMYIHNFKDSDGNVFIWKTSKCPPIEDGQHVTVKGTIKDHSEYQDEKQTVLTRCKITK